MVSAKSVVVVGGGLSGASFSLQLSRATRVPLAISIVEPRAALGPGLPYSTDDPDHRLNGPLDMHTLDPARPHELRQWATDSGIFDADPACLCPSGVIFLRRRDYGRYLAEELRRHARNDETGSTIRHVRDTAMAAHVRDGGFTVDLSAGAAIAADMLVIATGNGTPALRAPFAPKHASHPRIVANPLEQDWLRKASGARRVLVAGSALTALDIVSSLLRDDTVREIVVVSRRGLRPAPHAPIVVGPDPIDPAKMPVFDPSPPVPDFLLNAPLTALGWSQALRDEIRRAAGEGRPWQEAFDLVRDVVHKIWPRLPSDQKRRFLRRLRVFYDAHRFRAPPTNDDLVRRAEKSGRVRFAAASLTRISAASGAATVDVEMIPAGTRTVTRSAFDLVVNCTGFDAARNWQNSPFLASLVTQGLLAPHPAGLGFEVDEFCATPASPLLRVVGPPTAGTFGDPLGVVFITGQIARVLPDVRKALEAGPRAQDACRLPRNRPIHLAGAAKSGFP